jgi:hypothetical protein
MPGEKSYLQHLKQNWSAADHYKISAATKFMI